MPRKQDPAIGVIDYFQTAELSVALSTLAVATSIVRKRAPAATKKKQPSAPPAAPTPRKKQPADGPGPGSPTVGD